jgi:hypothetical protein
MGVCFSVELYRPDVLDDLMKESEAVVNRRKECIKMIGALEKANEVRCVLPLLSLPSSRPDLTCPFALPFCCM